MFLENYSLLAFFERILCADLNGLLGFDNNTLNDVTLIVFQRQQQTNMNGSDGSSNCSVISQLNKVKLSIMKSLYEMNVWYTQQQRQLFLQTFDTIFLSKTFAGFLEK